MDANFANTGGIVVIAFLVWVILALFAYVHRQNRRLLAEQRYAHAVSLIVDKLLADYRLPDELWLIYQAARRLHKEDKEAL